MKAKREKPAKREKREKRERPQLKFNWKIAIPLLVIMVAAAVVCVILFLRDGENVKKKAPKLPSAYAVGQLEIPAMTPGKKEEVTWTQDAEGVYTYEGFEDNGAAAEAYVQQVLDGGIGFKLVDDGYVEQEELPEFSETSGTVSLARDSEESGKLYSIVVEWTEENCIVKLDIPEGKITKPKKTVESTLSDKLQHFKNLSPAVLGLEGTSMEEYEVYAMTGTVLVDEYACLQINVYSKNNPHETNDPCGMFLITSDETHMYRLDKENGTITELDIP